MDMADSYGSKVGASRWSHHAPSHGQIFISKIYLPMATLNIHGTKHHQIAMLLTLFLPSLLMTRLLLRVYQKSVLNLLKHHRRYVRMAARCI